MLANDLSNSCNDFAFTTQIMSTYGEHIADKMLKMAKVFALCPAISEQLFIVFVVLQKFYLLSQANNTIHFNTNDKATQNLAENFQ